VFPALDIDRVQRIDAVVAKGLTDEILRGLHRMR
jgi:hypothetical protein